MVTRLGSTAALEPCKQTASNGLQIDRRTGTELAEIDAA
jgi:hypothetical protein